MISLQGLLFGMLGCLTVIVVSFSEDPNHTLTEPNSADTALTRLTKPNGIDYEITASQDCADRCTVTDRRIECNGCIPENVPSAVDEIVLSRFNESTIVPKMFCGVSWPHVINLTILSTEGDKFYIKNFTFDCLPKIKTLKLGLQQLINFSHNALYGLDNVRTLDLTDCVRLEIYGLTLGLSSDAYVPRLQTLILHNVGSAFDGIRLSQDFVDILAHRKVSTIDISTSLVGFTNRQVNIEGLCGCVEKLNLANSILIDVRCVPFTVCDSLRVIDLSRVTLPRSPIFEGNITLPPGFYTFAAKRGWMNAFHGLSTIYANSMISADHFISLNNVTLHLRVNNSITEVHLNGYSVPVCEAKFHIDPNHLKYFDLSNNKIESLSPDSFAYLVHLEILDLSNNKLAVSNQYENTFSNLFRNNAKLKIARLAHNGLKHMPSNVFELNTELKTIDLSNNKVTQIPFEIAHLYKLELLDLRRNSIKYLNVWSRHQIDMLYKHKKEKRNTTHDKYFTLDLRDNIFSCKCYSMDFIKWFIHSPVFEQYRDSYYCEVDGKRLTMNTFAVEACQYNCDKPKRKVRELLLSVLLPCVSIGILVVCAIVLFKRYKRNKLLRRLREQIYLIQENQSEYRFPVFLSYASEDSEFVEPNVLQPLQVSLFCTISHFEFEIIFFDFR